jgi:hypothetical protein
MDDLTKQLCKLERDVAKYIYIKYLQLPIDKPNLESKNTKMCFIYSKLYDKNFIFVKNTIAKHYTARECR